MRGVAINPIPQEHKRLFLCAHRARLRCAAPSQRRKLLQASSAGEEEELLLLQCSCSGAQEQLGVQDQDRAGGWVQQCRSKAGAVLHLVTFSIAIRGLPIQCATTFPSVRYSTRTNTNTVQKCTFTGLHVVVCLRLGLGPHDARRTVRELGSLPTTCTQGNGGHPLLLD